MHIEVPSALQQKGTLPPQNKPDATTTSHKYGNDAQVK
jgi:hypothetical protein